MQRCSAVKELYNLLIYTTATFGNCYFQELLLPQWYNLKHHIFHNFEVFIKQTSLDLSKWCLNRFDLDFPNKQTFEIILIKFWFTVQPPENLNVSVTKKPPNWIWTLTTPKENCAMFLWALTYQESWHTQPTPFGFSHCTRQDIKLGGLEWGSLLCGTMESPLLKALMFSWSHVNDKKERKTWRYDQDIMEDRKMWRCDLKMWKHFYIIVPFLKN